MFHRRFCSLPLLATLSLAAGCQNSPGEEPPPAGNSAAKSQASSPGDPAKVAPPAASPKPSARPANPPPEPSAAGDDRPSVTPAAAASSSSGGPYVAVSRRAGSSIPDALGTGRFSVRDNCVVYTPNGSSDHFTPVFPPGTRLVRASDGRATALRIGGMTAEFGRAYRLSGGEVPLAAVPDAQLSAPVPARCPGRRFMLGRVTASP